MFKDPVADGNGGLILRRIKSPDYALGVSGWSINKDGTAEFNNATFRGNVVISGSGEELLVYDGTPAAGNLILAVAAADGADEFGNNYYQGLTLRGTDETNGGRIVFGDQDVIQWLDPINKIFGIQFLGDDRFITLGTGSGSESRIEIADGASGATNPGITAMPEFHVNDRFGVRLLDLNDVIATFGVPLDNTDVNGTLDVSGDTTIHTTALSVTAALISLLNGLLSVSAAGLKVGSGQRGLVSDTDSTFNQLAVVSAIVTQITAKVDVKYVSDYGGEWAGATYTAPIDAFYDVNLFLVNPLAAANFTRAVIKLNGNNIAGNNGTNGGDCQASYPGLWMSAGDVLTFFVRHNAGVNTNMTGRIAVHRRLS